MLTLVLRISLSYASLDVSRMVPPFTVFCSGVFLCRGSHLGLMTTGKQEGLNSVHEKGGEASSSHSRLSGNPGDALPPRPTLEGARDTQRSLHDENALCLTACAAR